MTAPRIVGAVLLAAVGLWLAAASVFPAVLTGGASFDAFGAFHFVFELKLTETPPVSDSARSVPFMLAGGSVPNSISIQFVAV